MKISTLLSDLILMRFVIFVDFFEQFCINKGAFWALKYFSIFTYCILSFRGYNKEQIGIIE